MTPAPVGFADDGPAGMAPGRTCRLLLVVTESRQEAYLRRYAGALAAFQSAQIGVLRDCRGAGGAAECCQAELPLCGPDSPGAKRVLPAGAPLGACIGAIAGRWPFDMLIAEWPQADEHVALHARLVSELGVTAVLVRHSDGALRRVVVPAGGGAHALEGIRVADALARAWSLDRQVLRIVQPGSSFWLHRADLKRQCRHIRDATRLYLDVADVAMPVSP